MVQSVNVPKFPTKVVNPDGTLTQAFFRFLYDLWRRSGGQAGDTQGFINTDGSVTSIPTITIFTGLIMAWPVATPPSGWILCDGSAVSRAGFSALFALIGTTYGIGDGSTTFNLPNLAKDLVWNKDLNLLPILSSLWWVIKT